MRVENKYAAGQAETAFEFWTSEAAARDGKEAESTPDDPAELFTMVPSRPFFPRGFLWDEGFHLLVLLPWDLDLAVSIVLSWFARMDHNGWIAREQILGPEARTKVPPKFQVQHPDHVNPPTLFLAVSALCDILSGKTPYRGHVSQYLASQKAARGLLATLYPLMKRHFGHFRRTQAGNMSYDRPASSEGYRWRGRTPQYTLASGLDDFPRAEPPHPGELHVDAISWVGAMCDSLSTVAS